KRAKNASQNFAKHSRFWALDGNVILQFDAVAFKVHRSRLSTQPVWFEKLFERRAGREEPLDVGEENIRDVVVEELHGCDIYHLDTVSTMSDFEALLTAMEDSIEFYYSAPTYLTVSAVFRAATVFNFPKFFSFAKQYLMEEFSNDLDSFDPFLLPHPAAALILGRTWNLPQILKRAFYELACSDPESAVEIDTAHPLYDLEKIDLIRLAKAQKHLNAAWLTIIEQTTNKCPSKTPMCVSGKRSAGWAALAAEDQLLLQYQRDPITGLERLATKNWVNYAFCDRRAEAKKASFIAKREEIWSDMDEWFGIVVEEEDA
ncbi:hypothetical protein B0H10DRAFT_2304200, partial [Mycena sp. CBHHK59/15]